MYQYIEHNSPATHAGGTDAKPTQSTQSVLRFCVVRVVFVGPSPSSVVARPSQLLCCVRPERHPHILIIFACFRCNLQSLQQRPDPPRSRCSGESANPETGALGRRQRAHTVTKSNQTHTYTHIHQQQRRQQQPHNVVVVAVDTTLIRCFA